MPKGQQDTLVFLAVAAATFDPQKTYTESEVNDHLRQWMSGFVDLVMLDHVTVRRYLADYRYLVRDVAGSRYRANQAVINLAIEPEARMVQPWDLLQDAEAERKSRKVKSDEMSAQPPA